MQLDELSSLITQKLEMITKAKDPHQIFSKRKAITAVFPYAVWQEQSGKSKMFEMFLYATSASRKFMWYRIHPFINTLFNKVNPASTNQVITLASPYIHWDNWEHNKNAVTQWAATALAVPYTEEVGQSVANTLLQIVHSDTLRPYIPIDIWPWLKRQPHLLPIHHGRQWINISNTTQAVQELNDIEILKSYLLLVWSEWGTLTPTELGMMFNLVREDFGGIGMGGHRADLSQRLDYILGQLDYIPGRLDERVRHIYFKKLLATEYHL